MWDGCLFCFQIELLPQGVSWIILSSIPGCKGYVKKLVICIQYLKTSPVHARVSLFFPWEFFASKFLNIQSPCVEYSCHWMQSRWQCQLVFLWVRRKEICWRNPVLTVAFESTIAILTQMPSFTRWSHSLSSRVSNIALLSSSEMRYMSLVSLTGMFRFWE